jgi:hypothetical protein
LVLQDKGLKTLRIKNEHIRLDLQGALNQIIDAVASGK